MRINTQDSEARKHNLEQLLCQTLHKGQSNKKDAGKSLFRHISDKIEYKMGDELLCQNFKKGQQKKKVF